MGASRWIRMGTAAVHAAMPGRKPIVNCTCSKVRENSTPAMPASTPPIAKVMTITRSTLMPIRLAISRSCATARIDRPVVVVDTNHCRTVMQITATTNTSNWILCTGTPKIVMLPANTTGFGKPYGCGPKNPRNVFCRKSEAPIAVMSGTSLGALRRGRYASRSSRTAVPTETPIATAVTIASARMGSRSRKPLFS